MPIFQHDDAEIYYELHGSGFPVLLIAPGGMRSAIPLWDRAPWNPVTALAADYQVITMDQRNAGRSHAPVRPGDDWSVYLGDQLALLDHLGVSSFHVGGMCIGGAYALGLAAAAPTRVRSATIFQTIGLAASADDPSIQGPGVGADNRQAFYDMFDSWATGLAPSHPALSAADWRAFRANLYDGDFVFAVDREFVSRCPVPLLVLCGNDLYHPRSVSLEVARLAPHAMLIEHWKRPEDQPAARAAVAAFLARHTPGQGH